MRNLIFVGLPGSGKSTVGRLAARTLGLPFVDADKALEQAEGRSIPDIFADGGESYFRTLETRVLTDLCPPGRAWSWPPAAGRCCVGRTERC